MATSLQATHGPHRLLRKGLLSEADSRSCLRYTAAQGSSCAATCQVGRQLADTLLRRRTMFCLQLAAGGRPQFACRYLSSFARALASPSPQTPQSRAPFRPLRSGHPDEANSSPDHSNNGIDDNGFGGQSLPQDVGSEASGGGNSTAEKKAPVAAVLAEMRQRLKRANGKRGGVAGAQAGPANGRAESSSGRQAAVLDVSGTRDRPHLPTFKHASPAAVLSAPAPQTAVERGAEKPTLPAREMPSPKTDLFPSAPSQVTGNGHREASKVQDGAEVGEKVASRSPQELPESVPHTLPQSLQTALPRNPPPSKSLWSPPSSLSPSQKSLELAPESSRLASGPETSDAANGSASPDREIRPSPLRRLPPMKLRSRSLFKRSGGSAEERPGNAVGSSGRGPTAERSPTISNDQTASSGSMLRSADANRGGTGQSGVRERKPTERNGGVDDLRVVAQGGHGEEASPEGELERGSPLTEWMHASKASEPLSRFDDSRGSEPLNVPRIAEESRETESLVSDAERLSLDSDDDAPLTEWLSSLIGASESEGSQPVQLPGSSTADSSQQSETSQMEVENASQTAAGVSEVTSSGKGGGAAPLTEWLTPLRGDMTVLGLEDLSVSTPQAPLTEWRPEPSTARDGVERASSESRFRLPIPLVEPTPGLRTRQPSFSRFLPKRLDRPALRSELLPGMSPKVEQADRNRENVNGSDSSEAPGASRLLESPEVSQSSSDGAQSISDVSQRLSSGPQIDPSGSPSVLDGSQSFSDVAKSLLDASQIVSGGPQSVSDVSKSLSDAFAVVSDGPKSVSDGPDLQRTPEWYALRRWRLTASAFASAVGFFPEQRLRLWEEKLELREPFRGNEATVWGTKQEAPALEQYARITGNQVTHQSFQVYKEPDDVYTWLGASPDGLIAYDSAGLGQGPGVLEAKCPFGREGPENAQPYPKVPFYYIPQVQGLLEIFDRQWADFFVWTVNGSVVFRVERDPAYWALLFPVLSHFWWLHVVPAKHEMVHGRKDPDYLRTRFEPQPKDVRTELIIAESKRLSARSPAIWTDSGRVRNGRNG